MSWSVNIVGKAHAVRSQLQKRAESMTGQSRKEYEEALPHLLGLVALNEPSHELGREIVQVEASGHATIRVGGDGSEERQNSSCTVLIRKFPGEWAE